MATLKTTKAKHLVVQAALNWHHWLVAGGVGADYRKYCAAFRALKRSVSAYKKLTGREFLKRHGIK